MLNPQGKVDLDAEVAKIQKKLDLSVASSKKLKDLASKPEYAKIPEAVRTANVEKVRIRSSTSLSL